MMMRRLALNNINCYFRFGSTTILMEKRKNRTNVISEFYGEQRNKISAISPKKRLSQCEGFFIIGLNKGRIIKMIIKCYINFG